jgi:uncharacterized integral membrane protein
MTRSKLAILGVLVLLTLAVGLVFIIEVRYEGASRLPWMPLGIALIASAGVGAVVGSVARAMHVEAEEARPPRRRRVSGTSW